MLRVWGLETDTKSPLATSASDQAAWTREGPAYAPVGRAPRWPAVGRAPGGGGGRDALASSLHTHVCYAPAYAQQCCLRTNVCDLGLGRRAWAGACRRLGLGQELAAQPLAGTRLPQLVCCRRASRDSPPLSNPAHPPTCSRDRGAAGDARKKMS